MNTISFVFVAALAVSTGGEAKSIPDHLAKGTCPVVDEANLWASQQSKQSQLGGTWYQHSLTLNEYQPIEQCLIITFDFDGENFQTRGTGLDEDGNVKTTEGRIYPSPGGEPRFMIAQEKSTPAPLVVLDTDYSNYVCLYSCMEFGGSHYTDFGFIYSRTPKLDDAHVKACHDAFNNIGVEPQRFIKTSQGNQCHN